MGGTRRPVPRLADLTSANVDGLNTDQCYSLLRKLNVPTKEIPKFVTPRKDLLQQLLQEHEKQQAKEQRLGPLSSDLQSEKNRVSQLSGDLLVPAGNQAANGEAAPSSSRKRPRISSQSDPREKQRPAQQLNGQHQPAATLNSRETSSSAAPSSSRKRMRSEALAVPAPSVQSGAISAPSAVAGASFSTRPSPRTTSVANSVPELGAQSPGISAPSASTAFDDFYAKAHAIVARLAVCPSIKTITVDPSLLIKEYIRFLYIKDAMVFSPSLKIDAVWHRHILDTRHYVDDITALCGRMVHHNPAGEFDSVELKRQRYSATLATYEGFFGANSLSAAADIWPRVSPFFHAVKPSSEEPPVPKNPDDDSFTITVRFEGYRGNPQPTALKATSQTRVGSLWDACRKLLGLRDGRFFYYATATRMCFSDTLGVYGISKDEEDLELTLQAPRSGC
ncbi:hypothetical protein BDZ88DRAFT_477474 [Geranomyces variabilis]|nr:hypothetical protein BDZ88DRAFT_477474 [Geranomyces variabilis]KAJ3140963.1 hypothetical protein HDU90_006984 [Geranomyces variabilis]